MTAKELKRLRRSDLLEILLDLRRENERLTEQLEEAQRALQSRSVAIEETGSLADAVLRLSGVFEAAQEACDQYMENVKQRCEAREEQCQRLERATKKKCDQMILDAARLADAIRQDPTKAGNPGKNKPKQSGKKK